MRKSAMLSFLVGKGVCIDSVKSTYIQTGNMKSAKAVYLTKCLMDAGVLSSDIAYFDAYYGGFLRINFEEDEEPEEFVANPTEVRDVLINIFHDKIIDEMSECDGALRDVTSEVAHEEYDVRAICVDGVNRRLVFKADGYVYGIYVGVTKSE